MNGDFERRLARTLARAVAAGGRIIRRHLAAGSIETREKSSPGDLVSNVDLQVEREVLRILGREFPSIPAIGEEGGGRAAPGGAPAKTPAEAFYIDPIDGTLNFVHGFPSFAVSIGYWREGVPVAGAVGNPLTGELFAARRGGGATRNGRPLAASRAATLRGSMVATGWPYDRSDLPRLFAEMDRVFAAAQEIRTFGCASLALCYVAAGVLDGYWEWDLKPWDMAAGVLVVSEAGGKVSLLSGADYRLDAGEVLASNGRIHAELARTLAR